jgi:uncharacterized protein (DUF58 family)
LAGRTEARAVSVRLESGGLLPSRMIGLARRLASWWWRRTKAIKPTRDGWWCVFAAVGLGVAAVNTGNNLAYLLCAMLLALIIVSGMLSDLTIRGLRATVTVPDAIHATQTALVTVALANRKRRLASYSVALEALDRPLPEKSGAFARWRPRRTLDDRLRAIGLKDRRGLGAARRLAYVAQIPAETERVVGWEITLAARGRRRLPRLRATTAFPFGLFVKIGPPLLFDQEVVVFPAVHPVSPRDVGLATSGESVARRRGRGHDLYNLRGYRAGDEPHLIHWPTSAKSGTLVVRELEEDTTEDARIVLTGTGAIDGERLERALSEAASLAVHLLRSGTGVELAGSAGAVPLGQGWGQERRILTALALYSPPGAGGTAGPAAVGELREIRISLDPV